MAGGNLQIAETRFFKHAASSLIQLRLIEKQSAMVKTVEQDPFTQFMLHGFETTLTDIFMSVAENPSLLYQINMPESVVAPFMTQKAALAYAMNLKKRLLEAGGGVGFGVEALEPHEVADLRGGTVEIVLPPKTRKMPLSEFPHLRHYSELIIRELLRAVTQTVAAVTTSKYLAELTRTVALERELEREESKQKRMLVNAVDELVVFKQRVRALEEELRLKEESNKSTSLFKSKAKRQQHLASLLPNGKAGQDGVGSPLSAQAQGDDEELIKVEPPPVSALGPAPSVTLDDKDYIDQQTDRLVNRLVTNRLLTIFAGKEEFKVFNRQIEDLTATVAELTTEKAAIRVQLDAKTREVEAKQRALIEVNTQLTYKVKEINELHACVDQLQDALDTANEKYETAKEQADTVPAPDLPPPPLLSIYVPDGPAIRQFPSAEESRRLTAVKKHTPGRSSPAQVNAAGEAPIAVTAEALQTAVKREETRLRLDMVGTDCYLIRAAPSPPPAAISVALPEVAVLSKTSKPSKTSKTKPLIQRNIRQQPLTQQAIGSKSEAALPKIDQVDRAVQANAAVTPQEPQRHFYSDDEAEDSPSAAVPLPLFRTPMLTVETQTDFGKKRRLVTLSPVTEAKAAARETPGAVLRIQTTTEIVSTPPGPEHAQVMQTDSANPPVGPSGAPECVKDFAKSRGEKRRSVPVKDLQLIDEIESEFASFPKIRTESQRKTFQNVSLRMAHWLESDIDEQDSDSDDSMLSPGALMQRAMEELLLVDAAVGSDEVEESEVEAVGQFVNPKRPPVSSVSNRSQVARVRQLVGNWSLAGKSSSVVQDLIRDSGEGVDDTAARKGREKKAKKISYAALAERTDAMQLARVFDRLYLDAVERLERVKSLVEDTDTAKQMKLEKIFCVFRAVTSLARVGSEGVSPDDFRAFFSHYVETTPHKPIKNFWLSNNFFARRKHLPKRQKPAKLQLPSITVNNLFVSHLPVKHQDTHDH